MSASLAKNTADSVLIEVSIEGAKVGVDISTPPVPIIEICLLRDLLVTPQINLQHEEYKLAGMLRAVQREVLFEAKDTLGRQHFSIAHELGHYELHWKRKRHLYDEQNGLYVDNEKVFGRYSSVEKEVYTQSGILFRANNESSIICNPQMEAEANYFAQYIMMPEELIRKAVQEVLGLPYQTVARHLLAQQFEVSDMAMDLRLKQLQLVEIFDYSLERKFFNNWGQLKVKKQNTTRYGKKSIVTLSPQSRLRTLIAETDKFINETNDVLIDAQAFDVSELEMLGVPYVVDLALFHDYLTIKYNISSQKIQFSFPNSHGHLIRHMRRLGLSNHFDIGDKQHLFTPQPVITGHLILQRLIQINSESELEKIVSNVSHLVAEWGQGLITDIEKFINLISRIIYQFANDIILYSASSFGQGKGYFAAELQNIYLEDKVIGYKILIAIGDVGIPLMNRLCNHIQIESTSTYEAINKYIGCDTHHSALFNEIYENRGYIQINTGDVAYNIGANSNYFTKLYETQGMQITTIINIPVEKEATNGV